MNTKIKVLIIKSDNNISKMINSIWESSKKKIEKLGYSFEYYYESYENTKSYDWEIKTLKKIENNTFDIVLWPFNRNFNIKNTEFSIPILIEKQSILYSKDVRIKNIELYYLDLFKFWIPFILILVFLSFFMNIIFNLFFSEGSNFKKNYFRFLHASLQSNKNLFLWNKTQNLTLFLFFIICSIIFYIAYMFLHSVTTAKSILYSSPVAFITDSIKGSNILLNENDKMNIKKVESQGGIIKKSKKTGLNLLKEYSQNLNNYDGVCVFALHLDNYNIKDDKIQFKGLKQKMAISENSLGFNELSLPIYKKNKDLYKIINNQIDSSSISNKTNRILCGKKTTKNKYKTEGLFVNIPCLV